MWNYIDQSLPGLVHRSRQSSHCCILPRLKLYLCNYIQTLADNKGCVGISKPIVPSNLRTGFCQRMYPCQSLISRWDPRSFHPSITYRADATGPSIQLMRPQDVSKMEAFDVDTRLPREIGCVLVSLKLPRDRIKEEVNHRCGWRQSDWSLP